jgi:hypothetical protein
MLKKSKKNLLFAFFVEKFFEIHKKSSNLTILGKLFYRLIFLKKQEY